MKELQLDNTASTKKKNNNLVLTLYFRVRNQSNSTYNPI